ncbi:hypothetical protein ACP70R_014092 [Stipagrostis hirtigluma subsp. patula]
MGRVRVYPFGAGRVWVLPIACEGMGRVSPVCPLPRLISPIAAQIGIGRIAPRGATADGRSATEAASTCSPDSRFIHAAAAQAPVAATAAAPPAVPTQADKTSRRETSNNVGALLGDNISDNLFDGLHIDNSVKAIDVEQFVSTESLLAGTKRRSEVWKVFYLSVVDQRYATIIQSSPSYMSKSLAPRTCLKDDCMKIYEEERLKLYDIFDKQPGRFSLTSDMWTHTKMTGYMSIAIYLFITVALTMWQIY